MLICSDPSWCNSSSFFCRGAQPQKESKADINDTVDQQWHEPEAVWIHVSSNEGFQYAKNNQ